MECLETQENRQLPNPSSHKEVLRIRRNKLYTLTGTLLFKRFLPTGGDLINKHLHLHLIENYSEESLKGTLRAINGYEITHWIGFTLMTGISAFVLFDKGPVTALEISLVNIPINIYPLLLQRYNRQRLNHALNRFRSLRG